MKLGERVFCYGSLRQGLQNHYILEDHKALYLGMSSVEGYKMYSLGAFPGVKSSMSGTIQGEVYEIPSEDLSKRLDWLEGHPNFYKREIVTTVHGGKVWLYVLQYPARDCPLVPGGDWLSYYREKKTA